MAFALSAVMEDEVAVQTIDFASVFRDHFDFVWRSARRLGVRAGSIDDVVQEVFLVVHRRLGDFEGRSSLKSWVYGITVRVVRNHQRTLRRKPEDALPIVLHDEHARSQHETMERTQAAEALLVFLEALPEERREIFVMVDLEQESVADAAIALEINVNTAHARLRSARGDFENFVKRYRAQESRRPL